jgi:hypothetical protein
LFDGGLSAENPAMNKQTARPALLDDAEEMCAIYNAAIGERSSTFETELRSAADFEARVADERFPLIVSNGDKGVIGWAGIASYSALSASLSVVALRQWACIRATGSSMAPGATSWWWSGFSQCPPQPRNRRLS